jgi:hypothetical protein
MIDLNDSGTRGNITRVDILKMTKQSPHNAAILSKLTHSQLHGTEQVGQGIRSLILRGKVKIWGIKLA